MTAHGVGVILLGFGLVPPMVVDNRSGITHPLEFALYSMGAVSTAGAFLLLAWKLIRPHVEDYVENRVEAVNQSVRDTIKPMAGQVQAVRNEVPLAAGRLDDIRDEVDKLTRLLGHVDNTLEDHVTESRQYLDKAVKALADQGVALPTYDDD